MKSKIQESNLEVKEIRVGLNTRIKNIINDSIEQMKNTQIKELKFSAVGGSIGKLIEIIETLKVFLPGIYQQNRLSTVAYIPINNKNDESSNNLYPKLEIRLLKNEPQMKNEGYQGSLPEENRKIIEKIFNKIQSKKKIIKLGNNRVKRLELKKIALQNRKDIKSKITTFLNEFNIQQNYLDNQKEDKLFNKLKIIENQIILDIIVSNKKSYKKKLDEFLIKTKEDLYSFFSNFIRKIFNKGEKNTNIFDEEISYQKQKYVNFLNLSILVIGKSKVGKSVLIKKIQKMKNENEDNLNIEKSYLNIIEENKINFDNEEIQYILKKIKDYINKKNIINDQNDSIRCLWYLITGNNSDKKEIEIIKELKNNYKNKIPIIIIYTKASNKSEYDKVLKEYKENGLDLIPILAEKIELFGGQYLEEHGIDNLLNVTLDSCKISFKDNLDEALTNIILNIIDDFSIKNKEFKEQNLTQLLDDFISNYKNENFIEFITNVLLKNLYKSINQENINNEDNIFVQQFLNKHFKELIEYTNNDIINYMNIKSLIKEKTIELLNEQVQLEKKYNTNMLVENKRDLDEFEISIESGLKENFIYLAQRYYISFIIENIYPNLVDSLIKMLNNSINEYIYEKKEKELRYLLEEKYSEFQNEIKNIFLSKNEDLPPAKKVV